MHADIIQENNLTHTKYWSIDWAWFNVSTNTVYGRQFYSSRNPTNSIKVLKGKRYKGKPRKSKKTQNTHTYKTVHN